MRSLKWSLSILMLGAVVSVTGCTTTLERGAAKQVLRTEPRIKPLAPSEWTAKQREVLGRYQMSGGRFPNLLTTLANHPRFFERYLDFSNYIALESTLPPRDREILILRTGWLCQSEFELGWHTLRGKAVGLTEEEITRIAEGSNASGWDPFDATLLRATDELYYNAFVSDATWYALAKRYNQQQLMDVVFTVGVYDMTAMFLNSFGVQLDQGVPRFPESKHK